MKVRRLGLVLLAVPCAFAAYACSSDESGTTDDTDAGDDSSVVTNPDGSQTGTDGSTGADSGKDAGDSGIKDAGDAGDGGDGGASLICIGNPLTADGGDAGPNGFTVDAAAITQILDEVTATGNSSSFADGPQWVDLDGGSFLAFSDVFSQQLLKIQPDGGGRTPIRTATDNLLFIGNGFRDGGIYTAQSNPTVGGAASLALTLTDGGKLADIAIGASNNPNDVALGPKGDIYFTDPQYQHTQDFTKEGVYRISPTGTVTQIEAIGGRPNGIALSPDALKLYVGLTEGPAVNVIVYPVDAAGAVGAKANFVTATDPPDGLAVDTGGNVWIAEAAAANGQSGRVEVFSPAGVKMGEIPFADQRPTGVAFGGGDRRAVYITTEHRIYKFQNRCAGMP